MNKFPMITKLGMKVKTEVGYSFDGKTNVLESWVSASELEEILQAAQRLYFQKTGAHYQYFKTEKGHGSTHCGLLILPTEIFVCEKHEPAFDDEVTHCVHCGVNLVRSYNVKE